MLFYLQEKYNLPCEITNIIINNIKKDNIERRESKINKRKYKEVIKSIEYYSFINKMINKRKHKDYNMNSTINHFDT